MALVSTEMQLRSLSPGPERFMTMNLMSSGPCTVSNGITSYGRTVRRMKTRDNHTTADVDGARTFIRTSTLTNKPDSYGVSVRSISSLFRITECIVCCYEAHLRRAVNKYPDFRKARYTNAQRNAATVNCKLSLTILLLLILVAQFER